MKDVILNQHKQITRSLEVNKNIKVEGTFDSIILAGLGGSGHPGDLLNALSISHVPLYVHRNYDLPLGYLRRMGLTRPLVITSSYSGNTEETITAYQQARDNNLALLVSSSGGTLQQRAERDGIPFVKIDFPAMQPRHTLFAAFTGIYAALRNSGLADDIDAELYRVTQVLQEKTASLEKPAKALTKKITGKTPVFTSSETLGFAAKNFKIQTNENAKYPAFWNTFPELNHNEMVGFSKLKKTKNKNKFIAVLLYDGSDHPRNTARMQVTAKLYRQWGVDVVDVTAEGSSLLEKLFYTITFGLWTTYHLALAYRINPVPVSGVENFKKKLQKIAGAI